MRKTNDSERQPKGVRSEPANSHRASLRSKLVLSLGAMFLMFTVVDEFVRQQVIKPGFVALERNGAIRDAKRILAAIDVESEYLQELNGQLMANIDSETLTLNGNSSGDSLSESRRISWLAVVDPAQGSWHWIHSDPSYTPDDEQVLVADVSERHAQENDDSFRGMNRLPSKKLAMFAGKLIPNTGAKTTKYLVAGRNVDSEMVNQIRRQTQVDFSLQANCNSNQREAFSVWEADETRLVVETPLIGHSGQRLANVFVQLPRDITLRSQATTIVARNSFIIGSTVALVTLLLMLQHIVVGPLNAIRQHTERITENGLEASQLDLSRNDEIGDLATAFERMTLRLSDTQKQLADASHAAGMSQVADTVIHNIGNVLTNVNSLLETANTRVDGLRINPLEKLATRLRDNTANEKMLSAAPDYLAGLATELKSDRDELSSLLITLNDNIRHIHDVVRDQRRHTINTVNTSRFSINEILSEAIVCCQARLDQDNIEVTLPADQQIMIESDRSLLLQIIINIVGNARQAISENEDSDQTLHVQLEQCDGMLELSFHDSGCGMTQETLQRIFEAHFTTKNTGSGLGLHFCAIAMKKLKGSIKAFSDGTGCGSTFVLTVPMITDAKADQLTLAQAGAK